MKTIAPALQTALSKGTTHLSTCWKVTRQDGTVMGFTDHTFDIELDGVVYEAQTGYTRTAVASNSTLAVDNMDLEGAVRADSISAEDCRAGVYDYAEVLVFL